MATYSALAKYGKSMIMNIEWKKLLPKYWDWKKIIWPFRVLVHPIQAFNQIKYEKTGSVGLSIIILSVWFFSNISICQQIWKTQQWPQDWERSVFIPIPKKGNAKEC